MQLRDAAGVWLFGGPVRFLPMAEVEWQEPSREPRLRCQLQWEPEELSYPTGWLLLVRANLTQVQEQERLVVLPEASSRRASGRPG